MTSIKTMTIPALALVLAALTVGPASANLASGAAIDDAGQSGAIAIPASGIRLAAMSSYIMIKGQKSGSIKGKAAPPSPPAAGGGNSDARRTGVIIEDRK